MKNIPLRNKLITAFVIIWMVVFHYESTRYFYMNKPLAQKLPKIKFLFPPIGWIMFFSVGDTFGHRQVYGVKEGRPQLIDPHDIFRTRTIMFDNIHRGILTSASSPGRARKFCRFLNYRFPYFDNFFIVTEYYPEMCSEPHKKLERVEYKCS